MFKKLLTLFFPPKPKFWMLIRERRPGGMIVLRMPIDMLKEMTAKREGSFSPFGEGYEVTGTFSIELILEMR